MPNRQTSDPVSDSIGKLVRSLIVHIVLEINPKNLCLYKYLPIRSASSYAHFLWGMMHMRLVLSVLVRPDDMS
ncbi:MAG: hypothetical protein KME60_06860 [Cyanomargarita calcarea GSE-NOS-MK-12-04C]|jgi:hypothetical protein|uniref:Uncharacterized protein n=1 Tax=Cyanomargarita calcarea GSE-NOS-MK-12-04C TaxID=2839659 RepID=A0A951QJQ8_9CYAN|nr:hypothetical protein [Cyanomargarita calcarea GSE-NOS-MK-12-04C]